MNWIYGAAIDKQGEDHVVSVRDLPEVVTAGDTHEEALALAADAIAVIVAGRMKDEAELPPPSPVAAGEEAVPLDPHLAAKASVYALWRKAKISKSELARRMQRKEGEVRRLLDPAHGTKLDQLRDAAHVLGDELVVGTLRA
ncbi:MAG: type II toxin-antitoxin system HicB family antitoxin [Beijerinckiaceae bacterium]